MAFHPIGRVHPQPQRPRPPSRHRLVAAQRHAAHLKQLSPQRRQRLQDLSIDLRQPLPTTPDETAAAQPTRANVETWDHRYAELAAYPQRFGHCKVPRGWPEHPALDQWVHTQRGLNYRQRLNPGRFARLDALGFAWTIQNTSFITLWETRYAELCAYQREHGHTNVTKGQNRTLGHWRDVQREFRQKGILKPEPIARNASITFSRQKQCADGQ